MKILALRTDTGLAELRLIDSGQVIAFEEWQADRTLADGLLEHLEQLLKKVNWTFADVEAVAVFRGHGSFTGLRIGITVANALAYSHSWRMWSGIGDSWLQDCLGKLEAGETMPMLVPEYGAEPRLTIQKK